MSTLAAAFSSSTSSPRCVPFAFRRGGVGGRRHQPAPGSGRTASSVTHDDGAPPEAAAGGCRTGRPLCCAAEGVQSAFFVSLDRCSCVMVRTDSFKELEESEAAAAPLMSSSPLPSPPPHDGSGSGSAARSGGRRRASAGGKPRRGLCCCTCTPCSTCVN